MSLQLLGTGALVMPTGTTVLTSPAQFDNSTLLASTASVQQALGNFRGSVQLPSGATTLGATHWGQRLILTVGAAVTLPSIATVPAGTAVLVSNNIGASTITTTGADILSFCNVQVAVPYTISAGGSFYVVSDGVYWRAVLGTEEIKNSPLFGSSLITNGYQKLPSGLIIQKGQLTCPVANTFYTYTFPIAFPTSGGNTTVVCSAINGGVGAYYAWHGSPTSSSVAIACGVAAYVDIIAIGY